MGFAKLPAWPTSFQQQSAVGKLEKINPLISFASYSKTEINTHLRFPRHISVPVYMTGTLDSVCGLNRLMAALLS